MKTDTKRAILNYVRQHDRRETLVKLTPSPDFKGGKIRFSSLIKQHRQETSLTGEKWAEAYYITKLVHELGYDAESIELQKEYEIGRPGKLNKPRNDIILNHTDGSPFFLIEVKDPDEYEAEADQAIEFQLFAVANHERERGLKYLVYCTVDQEQGSLEPRARIIDFELYRTYEDWTAQGSFSADILPTDYALARKARFVRKSVEELRPEERALNDAGSPVTFAAIRKNLHDVLWAGGGMFYNDIFTNLVKLFLAKIYDEVTCAEGAAYKFQVESAQGRPQSSDDLFKKVNALYRDAQREFLNIDDGDEARGIDLEKISKDKVFYVVERIQAYSLTRNTRPGNGDILGQFFEGIVEQGFKQSRGQFFTHHSIVQFIIHALAVPEKAVELIKGERRHPPRLPYICDPSAGSGTFLIESMKAITNALRSVSRANLPPRTQQALDTAMPASKPHKWAELYLYGVEINKDLALATKVNMVVHGDGSINVFAEDGLADFSKYSHEHKVSVLAPAKEFGGNVYDRKVNENFDFIVSNPPFSIKPDARTAEAYSARFDFGSSERSENLFLERWFQLLRAEGRIGVVLPESVFDTTTAKATRLFLYRYFRLDAVVALPYLAFKPFTSTKTCILFATKRTEEEAERYITAERSYKRMVGKAIRRGLAYAEAEDDGARDRVARLIERDSDEERAVLGEIVGTGRFLSDILAMLPSRTEEWWTTVDDVQWVFRKVAAEFNHPVFYSDVDEVGYKRRRQGGDLVRLNQLFRADAEGQILMHSGGASVLEKMRAGANLAPTRLGFFSDFERIGDQSFLRCDPKYRWFWDKREGMAFEGGRTDLVTLNTFLEEVDPAILDKGPLDAERLLIELDDVEGGTGRIAKVQTTDEIGSNKIELGTAQIAFSKLEPYLGKAFLNDPAQEYIGSTEWLLFNVREGSNPRFWLALLLSDAMREVFRMLQSGKRHARLNPADLGRVLVPNFSRAEQNTVVQELDPLWQQLDALSVETRRIKGAVSARLAEAVAPSLTRSKNR